ncbi:putative LRR receptor-like serine/threonine-protein kinase At4g37250 [Tasmannia lanceolata]|uniref:putative LRR receptor-like serine/threonine-protein kinase At4g37250 n=1 Tax=Tasmannia lanceolata TaxID=3420 RepID=UPI0040631B86
MNFQRTTFLFLILLLSYPLWLTGLNSDGIFLLSFKYSILSDPLLVLQSWNYNDETPCAWNGVTCGGIPATNETSRVISLILPNSKLLGSIAPDLGLIQYLYNLDLSNNSLNGTLPTSLFNASQLQTLSLSNNEISGELPELVGNLSSLESLNLSDNAMTGIIPGNLSALPNLTTLSLKGNYFYGNLPGGFEKLVDLDLSSNIMNGSLPSDLVGGNLLYMNLSFNNLSGEISPELASRVPANATLDLSYNNLTGEIPGTGAFLNQKAGSFAGNPNLCGKPLKNPCLIPSTISTPPNVSTSPPAIAAIPKSLENPREGTGNGTQQGGMKPGVIAGIVVGDLAGIGILAVIFLYIYQAKKKRKEDQTGPKENKTEEVKDAEWSSDSGGLGWSCLRRKSGKDEETSDTTGSETEEEEEKQSSYQQQQKGGGSLVTVDGETELELETLLKASAYILGATGSSIVYKAVLENGTTFAVRRIGETALERFRDFENQVRLIAKLRHPNLLRLRGFYWGDEEKLVIYDYAPNGSLADTSYKKLGSSPCHPLSWDVRLRIARGVARGLTYLHEKKQVHGNLKPGNILLGPEMEPMIGDFGLERLIFGETSGKTGGSARHFGSKRWTLSRDSVQDSPAATGVSPCGSTISTTGCASPYHAPESLKILKPNPKWDIYSFGIVLLELLSGKIFSESEVSEWNSGFIEEDKNRVLRMVDVSLRADVEGKEEALLACFKLGFNCASMIPQKRPFIKEALQILDKISSSSSTNYYHYP